MIDWHKILADAIKPFDVHRADVWDDVLYYYSTEKKLKIYVTIRDDLEIEVCDWEPHSENEDLLTLQPMVVTARHTIHLADPDAFEKLSKVLSHYDTN